MSPEEAPSTPSVHSERQTPLATLSHITLPRLELHHFSGDPAKWIYPMLAVSQYEDSFVNTFHEHNEALKAIECDVTTQANPLLSALLLRKLDGDLRKRLESFRSSNEEETHTLPTVKDIILFLNTECNMSEDADLHSSAKKAPVKAFNQRSQKVTRFEDKHKPTALVTAHNINSNSCFACAVERRHNTTHHRSIPQPRVAGIPPPADVTSPTPVTLSTTKTLPPVHPPQQLTVLLGTILVKLTAENEQSHVFRGLLDSGSTCNLITCQAASLLGARRYHSNIQIAGLSQHASNTRGMLSLQVNTLSGQLIAPDQEFHILDKISVNLPRAKISPELSHLVKHYTLADPTFDTPCGIDVLLGGTIIPTVFTQENHSLGPGLPHLIGTQFGFILMGTAPCVTPTEPVSNYSIALLSTHDNSLHTALQKFWVQEEPPIINHKSIEEIKCDELFDSTHTRNGDGRYVVRLPFKTEPSCLGSSRAAAERRFVSLERKFQTQPQFAELYRNFMKDYKATGHMTLLDKHHADEPHYYLPHHGVIKESSSTTKLRTVFDASNKTTSGLSLNDVLLTGRKLQPDISSILINFRSHAIVFSCDIKQMYRQILVHPEDQNFQLILWREQEISTFKLTTVTYGMNSSPYLAIKTLSRLAEDEGHAFPDAAYALKHHTYIDDIVTGSASLESAIQLQDQLIQLLAKGGFELRKWASNEPRLLDRLPATHRETPRFLQDSQSTQFSILGLHWDPVEDYFRYNFKHQRGSLTKRHVLSLIARLYDPCGFLSPLIRIAKSFMQLLWTRGLQWDEQLPPELAEKWLLFVNDTRDHLGDIKIDRVFPLHAASSIELHGFCDASEKGVAAVIFIKCNQMNEAPVIRQAMSKTRVSPLKKITIPRLELCAAHLLSKLATYCIQQFSNITFNHVMLWSDSTVALHWIKTPPYQLKTYVANRVAEIQNTFPSRFWNYVTSSDNPSDVGSRGLLASQLKNHTLWFEGPQWLKLDRQTWPHFTFFEDKREIERETKEFPLSPFIDEADVIRVGGQLKNSHLNYESRHPVLLPKQHPVVNLIIDYYHRIHLHSGPQLTQALLSQEIWIISARSAIRSHGLVYQYLSNDVHLSRFMLKKLQQGPPFLLKTWELKEYMFRVF
ncbi:uncharacterized protein LOC124353908 [Homalodisca vitripennis]|uniref:uncharacterized protein LOC124353908 n=1 Tax=Homalodisca vitripennis TaxID=197043 RepID=UPI001EEA6D85|nr:uncharacterized protein LOC124353908 [Homalodisca vitripennis]